MVGGGRGPFTGRHLRRRFGPLEADLWGTSAMIEFVDVDVDLCLLWTDDPVAVGSGPGPGPDPRAEPAVPDEVPVANQLAALLRSVAGGTLDKPARVRAPVPRRLTEPAPAVPEVARAVRVSPVDGGARVEVETTVPGSTTVSVVLSAEQADGLADMLERWSRE
ncbi:hypothetical protein [Frankia sp. Cas3]|uniref:hypothetical protein n=1 Tax=Frankia sp. Cas3 TaxID=3073926 RepID=UPI002AD26DE6|nr:hypothetical protein [Frankia sp. Cas3]